MKKIEIYKDGKINKTLECDDAQFPVKMKLARLTAEVKSRKEGIAYKAQEYKEPVPEKKLTASEQQEILIAQKQQEILRGMAVSQLGITDPKVIAK